MGAYDQIWELMVRFDSLLSDLRACYQIWELIIGVRFFKIRFGSFLSDLGTSGQNLGKLIDTHGTRTSSMGCDSFLAITFQPKNVAGIKTC